MTMDRVLDNATGFGGAAVTWFLLWPVLIALWIVVSFNFRGARF